MNSFQTIVAGSLLFFWVGSGASITSAQEEPTDKAVVAISIDLEKILQSKTVKALTGDRSASQFFQIEEEGAQVFDNLVKVSGFVAAPKDGFGPAAFASTNMLIILEMKNEEVIKQMRSELEGGFVEIEKDGKKILKADGPGAPPLFARQDGKRFIFASESYLFADPKSVVSPELKTLIENQKSSPAYWVANLDGAREMLTELSKMASENADFMTKQYIGLIDQVATVELSCDIDGNPLLQLKLTGHNDKEGKQIKLKVDAAIGLLKGIAELGMAQLKKDEPDVAKLANDLMEALVVKQQDQATTVMLKRPMNFAERLGKAGKATVAARSKAEDMNKMRQVALSKHNYFDTFRKFPFDPEHTRNVSWRVRVLPFIEESRLHDQFDLDQKWSSESNKKLVDTLPDVYRLSNGATVSYIKPEKLPASFDEVIDGTSNTIVFVENRNAKMTPWTKPEGISPEKFVQMVRGLEDGDSLLVAFYDGRVDRISNQTSMKTLLKLCNPSDGEPIEEGEIK